MRVFTAVDLNDELKENISAFIEECRKKHQRSVKYVERENLHITMKFLGEMTDEAVAKLSEDLAAIRVPSVNVLAHGAGGFPNVFFPSVLWIGIKDDGTLEKLFREIEDKAAVHGVAKETKKFHPHATIARVKGKADSGLLELIKNCGKDFGGFLAESFVLMKSDLMPDGPVYTRLRTYPMQTRR